MEDLEHERVDLEPELVVLDHRMVAQEVLEHQKVDQDNRLLPLLLDLEVEVCKTARQRN